MVENLVPITQILAGLNNLFSLVKSLRKKGRIDPEVEKLLDALLEVVRGVSENLGNTVENQKTLVSVTTGQQNVISKQTETLSLMLERIKKLESDQPIPVKRKSPRSKKKPLKRGN